MQRIIIASLLVSTATIFAGCEPADMPGVGQPLPPTSPLPGYPTAQRRSPRVGSPLPGSSLGGSPLIDITDDVTDGAARPGDQDRPPSRLPEFCEGGQWLAGREGGFEGEAHLAGANPNAARLKHWRYDRNDEVTLRGPVLGKHFKKLPGDHTGVVVELQPGGNFIDVLIGTTESHIQSDVHVEMTDPIVVKGVIIDLPGRDLLLARELLWRDRALLLRDSDGWPLWYDRDEWKECVEDEED
jgi:hypothetical protein